MSSPKKSSSSLPHDLSRPPLGPTLEGDTPVVAPKLQEQAMQDYYQMNLDELCSRLIATTRTFIADFQTNDVAADANERGRVRRALDALHANARLAGHDNADLDPLVKILERERDQEIRGRFMVFEGSVDPDLGHVGEGRQVVDLTERGQAIEVVLASLRHIAKMRTICRARIDADNFLLGRMSTL